MFQYCTFVVCLIIKLIINCAMCYQCYALCYSYESIAQLIWFDNQVWNESWIASRELPSNIMLLFSESFSFLFIRLLHFFHWSVALLNVVFMCWCCVNVGEMEDAQTNYGSLQLPFLSVQLKDTKNILLVKFA